MGQVLLTNSMVSIIEDCLEALTRRLSSFSRTSVSPASLRDIVFNSWEMKWRENKDQRAQEGGGSKRDGIVEGGSDGPITCTCNSDVAANKKKWKYRASSSVLCTSHSVIWAINTVTQCISEATWGSRELRDSRRVGTRTGIWGFSREPCTWGKISVDYMHDK